MGILLALIVILISCLIIWRACDGFEIASEFVGRNLSEGVRGGTINAISSSMPELFTTLIALFVLSDMDGFAIGIGTTAGSALFNGMIIPALCILAVVGKVVAGKRVDAVRVSLKVILRDGISLVIASAILLVILLGTKLVWWQGLLLMAVYGVYLAYMIGTMKRSSGDAGAGAGEASPGAGDSGEDKMGLAGKCFYWLSLGPLLDLEGMFVREKQRDQIRNETWNGWPLLFTSTMIIGGACWLLVKGCEWLGTGPANLLHPTFEFFGREYAGIGMPTMFVAVIFASMATSVPDTIISIRDARDGDYDDAVANALGSNVFDICFALGMPLFLYTIIFGPIEMQAVTIQQSGELRFLLLLLTVVGFCVFLAGPWKREPGGGRSILLGRSNAVVLLSVYGLFLVYVVGRSSEAVWTRPIVAWINGLVEMLQMF